MLQPSPRLKREAAKIGCEPNHIILADLILIGYSEAEAFDIAYSEKVGLNAQQLIAKREEELASDKYKRAYDAKRETHSFSTDSIVSREKEDVLKELNIMASNERDTKLKAELLMKIAEIKQMKKDVISDNDDPVQFFLSIDCEKCPLLVKYNEYLALKNASLPEDKWDVSLRPDEMQRIMEQAEPVIKSAREKEKAGN